MSREKALAILARKGFTVVEVDMIELARQCVGTSRYRRGARLVDAPAVVDCSSFTKWLYGRRGIWLPRFAVQQNELGEDVIPLEALAAGDLVFVSSRFGFFRSDPADSVGHVGIYTGDGTVIHATSKQNVVETEFGMFIGKTAFRGARRYIPRDAEGITLEIPVGRDVETADDIRWIILQSLPKRGRI